MATVDPLIVGRERLQALSPDRRNSLFGRLVLLVGKANQKALDIGFSRLSGDPSKSLAEILVETGTVSESDVVELDYLLARHLAKYGDDPEASMSSMASLANNVNSPAALAETIAFVPSAGDGRRPQKLFGNYELLGEIARGGMGVVYKARQVKLNRLVALKMIRSGELADEVQVERFYAEAEAAAKLDHPGIVPVFEVGEVNGQHFFSMAFIQGQSLNDRVKADGPLVPKLAAKLLQAAANAIQYAHDKGIIHRDIKPQNILLDEHETPRVADFGLAKQVLRQSDLTATGQALGTPSYMPPEQASGKLNEIGPASDVYSLGATLYFLLTGRPPFQTGSSAETIQQVLNSEPVALRRLKPALPRDLETICLKCLRKESAKRYATAAELAADLGRWLEGMPIFARPVGSAERAWLWCKRRPTLVGLLLAFFALSLVGTLAGTLVSLERQSATRAAAMVEALMIAPPQEVPYALENLTPVRAHALPILRRRFTDESRELSQRLHAAAGLAHFGEVDVPFLVASIPKAQAGECANIVGALRHDPAVASTRLKAQLATAKQPKDRLRLVTVLLHLGEIEPAKQMLALAPDPSQRTLFIHHLYEWRGNLADYTQLLREAADPDLQSGLCQALGQIPVTELSVSERQVLEAVLLNLYANSNHGSTHSATKWTLQQLKMGTPKAVVITQAKPGRDWYVNPHGMTFLKIPAGRLLRKDLDGKDLGTVILSQDFWLSDCEVTRKQFEAFVADSDYPQEKRPKDWEISEFDSPTADCPVSWVSWFDAVLFCNWLSRREGLRPYYEKTGEKQKDPYNSTDEWDVWRSVPQATGYRLPTEAEWEYACRAKSAALYCFGDDESLLSHYAVFLTDKTQPVSSRQPNGWGLFDMHGNVFEWNYDLFDSLKSVPGQPIIDPTGPPTEPSRSSRTLRSAKFNQMDVNGARTAYRVPAPESSRYEGYGFRTARNYLRLAEVSSKEPRIALLTAELRAIEERILAAEQRLPVRQAEWERELSKQPLALSDALSNGLVAHYPLDETEGTKTANAVESQPVGTYQGSGQPEWVRGMVGGALRLDGKGNVIGGSKVPLNDGGPFSLGCWFKCDGPDGIVMISVAVHSILPSGRGAVATG